MAPEELEKIVKANQLALARIEEQLNKVSKKLLWNRIAGILKIILIFAPIIIGILYLTPMIKNATGGSWNTLLKGLQLYSGNLETLTGTTDNTSTGTSNSNNVSQSLLKDFCNPELREVYVRNLCN